MLGAPTAPSQFGVCLAALVVFAFEASNACAREASPLAAYLPTAVFAVAVALALRSDLAHASAPDYLSPNPDSICQTAVISFVAVTPLAYHTADAAERLAAASIASVAAGLFLIFLVDALFLLGFLTILVVSFVWVGLTLPWLAAIYLVLGLECNSRPLHNTLITLSLFPLAIAIVDGTLPSMQVFAPILLALGVKWKLLSTAWGWALLIPAAANLIKRVRATQ